MKDLDYSERPTIREIKDWIRITDKRKQKLLYSSNNNAFIVITKECSDNEIDEIGKAIKIYLHNDSILGAKTAMKYMTKSKKLTCEIGPEDNTFVVRGP